MNKVVANMDNDWTLDGATEIDRAIKEIEIEGVRPLASTLRLYCHAGGEGSDPLV